MARRARQQSSYSYKTQIILGVLSIMLVSAVVAGIYYGSRHQSVTLSEVRVSGGETIDTSYVKEVVESVLEGSYAGLIPKRFVYFYPHDTIAQALQTVPRLENPEITTEGKTVLVVNFQERVPHALWCLDAESCAYVDEEGYAYAEAPQLTGSRILRLERTGEVPVVGQYGFSISELMYAKELEVALLEASTYKVAAVKFGSAEDVTFTLLGGGDVLVNQTMSPVRAVENLVTVLNAASFSHLGPGRFAYIDLRFGEKVFVNEFGVDDVSSSTTNAAETAAE